MKYEVLTKIDREILSLDPEIASGQQFRQLAWARSSLSSLQERKRDFSLVSWFYSLKGMLSAISTISQDGDFLSENHEIGFSRISPQLSPVETNKGSLCPERYFAKGSFEEEVRDYFTPISYLLVETNEIAAARPVPGSTTFLRSLAKGKGVLRRNKHNFFYLDIDDRFIVTLIPYLKKNGLVKPPYFSFLSVPHGAHIPVIPPREAAFHFLDTLKEVNQEFSFEIEGLFSIEPALWPQVEQIWFFQVKSPQLEVLRLNHCLLAKPGGHSFHIAVAVKLRPTAQSSAFPLPIMQVNPACLFV